jgi:hypothetical protein
MIKDGREEMEDKSNGQRRMEENMWGGQGSSRTVEPRRRRRRRRGNFVSLVLTFEAEGGLNYIYKFCPYSKENTILLHF